MSKKRIAYAVEINENIHLVDRCNCRKYQKQKAITNEKCFLDTLEEMIYKRKKCEQCGVAYFRSVTFASLWKEVNCEQ